MCEHSNTYVPPEIQTLWLMHGFREENDWRFIPPDKLGSLQIWEEGDKIYPEERSVLDFWFAVVGIFLFLCFGLALSYLIFVWQM